MLLSRLDEAARLTGDRGRHVGAPRRRGVVPSAHRRDARQATQAVPPGPLATRASAGGSCLGPHRAWPREFRRRAFRHSAAEEARPQSRARSTSAPEPGEVAESRRGKPPPRPDAGLPTRAAPPTRYPRLDALQVLDERERRRSPGISATGGRRAEHETAHPIRPGDGQLLGHHPAGRNPDDVRRGETQPVEHRHRVAGHRSGRGGKHAESMTSPTPGARHRRR